MKLNEIIKNEINFDNNKNIIKTIYRCLFITDYNIVLWIRYGQYLNKRKFKFLSILVKNKIMRKFAMHVGMESKIGIGVKLPHPMGIVIGEGVTIGRNCTIYQNVTLGKSKGNLDKKPEYPIIGDNVTIFTGATIIGKVEIGNSAIIGANSVVITNVEPGSIYAGVPAKRKK